VTISLKVTATVVGEGQALVLVADAVATGVLIVVLA
jgi:hypothetical protein